LLLRITEEFCEKSREMSHVTPNSQGQKLEPYIYVLHKVTIQRFFLKKKRTWVQARSLARGQAPEDFFFKKKRTWVQARSLARGQAPEDFFLKKNVHGSKHEVSLVGARVRNL